MKINSIPVKERDNLDLLELVCQLHSRSLSYPSKHMHDAYIEARKELESRLSAQQFTTPVQPTQDEWMDFVMYLTGYKQEQVDRQYKNWETNIKSEILKMKPLNSKP